MDWLFQTDEFMARSACGSGWTPVLRTVNQFSNLLIFMAYMTISASLIYFWVHHKKSFPFSIIHILFASFIFMCGWTHFNEVIVFYSPMYRLFTTTSVLCAVISFMTCLFFPKFIIEFGKEAPREILNRLNFDLYRLNESRRSENQDLTDRNKSLVTRIHILEGMLNDNAWIHDKETALKQLKEMLATIGPVEEGPHNGS